MTDTFLYTGLESFDNRFKEIELILNHAVEQLNKNVALHNSLCRSAQVFLTAHFEGYVNDLVKNYLNDINYFSSFKKSQIALKRTYCKNFITKSDGSLSETKLKELIDVFDTLDTKFNKDYFLVPDRNPNSKVIDSIAERFGITKFFDEIVKTDLDKVFSNTFNENVELRNEMRKYLETNINCYPYNIDLTFIKQDPQKPIKPNLWADFLENILNRRHEIAHGKELNNSVDYNEIFSDKLILEIFILIFMMFICFRSNPAQ